MSSDRTKEPNSSEMPSPSRSQQNGLEQLASQLKQYGKPSFNGYVSVTAARSRQRWHIYFSLGRIVWATGGIHPLRRWRRYMARYCPKLNLDELLQQNTEKLAYWDYHLLGIAFDNEFITLSGLVALINSSVTEVLFDIVQHGYQELINYAPQVLAADFLKSEIKSQSTLMTVEQALTETGSLWKTWQEAGLAAYSPNYAPVIVDAYNLRRYFSASAYKNLTTGLNGKRSLRDLTSIMRQDLLRVGQALLPHLQKKLIKLMPLPDLRLPAHQENSMNTAGTVVQPDLTEIQVVAPSSPSSKASPKLAPLIACVDDSKQIGKFMEDAIVDAGYRFVYIQDPINVLPTVLKQNPDLIFLDLIMPIVTGFEICAQLRRVPKFKNTPIIMLTSNKSIIDRAYAMFVNVSGYLTKPVTAETILETVRKYLK